MRRWIALLAWLAAPALGSEEALTFADANGQPVEIRPQPETHPLLLHFWATWCADCAEDLAALDGAAAGCDGSVRVVAVNAGDGQDQVDAYLARRPLRLTVLRDPGGDVWRRLDGRGLPANVYWSAQGRSADLGPKTRAQWDERLASLGCPAAAPR